MVKKSLLFILMMALFAPMASMAQETRDWTLVTSFSCTTGRQHAVVYDGEHIYTAAWGKSSNVLHMFYKYDVQGNLIEEFDVPGVNTNNYLRDMTFDGVYIYGCDGNSNKIWIYDLQNKTRIGQISTGMMVTTESGTAQKPLSTCTYDPVHDAFWVGERATNESPDLMTDLYLVDRQGQTIVTATPQNIGGHTVHGTGYFTDEMGQAHLYLFAVQGFTAHVFDYNIDEDSMNPNYIFDFNVTPGWNASCSAGGAFIAEYDGAACFFGDVDRSPNLIGIYALGEYTPAEPVAPEGDIFFNFEDGIMRWNSIDADGDGYEWFLRTNWGLDSDGGNNRYSVSSGSYDDVTETALFPKNYLVTPYKLDCEQITFKARVQNPMTPAEHFAVAVSTTSDTDPSAFTTVFETTMTSKAAGSWHYFDVDLREYQGQQIYIAFVHFNCTNQFYLNIDDIMLHRVFDAVGENSLSAMKAYPNPVSDRVHVDNDRTVDSYEVYDITGAMVLRREVAAKSFDVDMRQLSAGTYFLKVNTEGLSQTKRIVKQ